MCPEHGGAGSCQANLIIAAHTSAPLFPRLMNPADAALIVGFDRRRSFSGDNSSYAAPRAPAMINF